MLHLTDATFAPEVAKARGLIMVDFWAPWCHPCRMTEPIVEALAQEFQGRAKIAKMNVDEHQGTPGQFGIMSIPTFLFFKDGSVVDQVVGGVSRDALKAKIEQHL